MAGSIPACAGEPKISLTAGVSPSVLHGLSPRVRGNRKFSWRLIPACAGEPRHNLKAAHFRSVYACAGEPTWQVYPRVCGGTRRRLMAPDARVYPRVCGGTSFDCVILDRSRWVYPRVCGGTSPFAPAHATRGSIPACAGEPGRPKSHAVRSLGSIPACAGEPSVGAPFHHSYPHRGLSPRVRGNLLAIMPSAPVRRVYPRVCGGTIWPLVFYPRVCEPHGTGNIRSIPACAGEPTARNPHWHVQARSIPACAGEPPMGFADRPGSQGLSPPGEPLGLYDCIGLSPRVRGNRSMLASVAVSNAEVYPRVCGGTTGQCWQRASRTNTVYPRVCNRGLRTLWYEWGLSPRVRGNRSLGRRMAELFRRSIPACAGEPRSWTPKIMLTDSIGLSPRVRGNRGGRPADVRWHGGLACAGECPFRCE